MGYMRNISEAIFYPIVLIAVYFYHELNILDFLTDQAFLNMLTESAITLSGIGIGLLGIILVLQIPTGIKGEFSKEDRKVFLSKLKRSTGYFLFSSLFAFSCFVVSKDAPVAISLCSAFSTILFLNGLAHLLYVCFTIDKVGSS